MVDGYAMPAGLEQLPAGIYVMRDGRAEPEHPIENIIPMSKDHVGDYARCSDDTRGLREEKERLYAQGFPILESQAAVAKYYSAEKFDHLRGAPNLVYFVAPSTTGENILPYILAQNLRRDFGGVILSNWATPQALTRTAEKTGVDKLREPPTYKIDREALALVPKDATVVLVDDVVTTGGSVQGMREALAQEGLRASHVTSLAQSELRLVRDADIDRLTDKLMATRGRDEFAKANGFANYQDFAAQDPDAIDDAKSGFNSWHNQERAALRADVALVLDGRLKHLANYIETSTRKTDANRNAEISEHFRNEAQRLRELGRTDAGAVLGIDERVRRLEGAQLAPRSGAGLDAGVSREGGSVRPGGPDKEGRDASAAGNSPGVTEPAKPLQASETLDRLTSLRLEYADNPDKHVLTEARGIADAVAGPDVTRVPFAVSAVEYVKGNISRADLEQLAAKNERAAAHDKNPRDRSQDNDLGR
jgi:adenine/guanine phosphoribosyltransferase-like PRPP-binding protein